MVSSNPVTLGILWSWCFLQILFSTISGENTNKESHKVYSYTYHFQHNGTNPRDFLQEILAGPDFDGDGRSIVKTISHPSLRGFVTKGVLPAGAPNDFSRGAGFGAPRDITIDGIKKIVQNSIPNLPPPPPLPPIPPPPVDFPGNFLKDNGPGDILKQVGRPLDQNHVVSNVENFVRHTPGGRVVGQTETFSYNPPPVNNVVNNIEGFRKSEQIVSHDQRSRGHVTQSFFRQHFNRNGVDGINRENVFGQRIATNNALNGNNEWWKEVRNVVNNIQNLNRDHGNNGNINFNNANRDFGSQGNRQHGGNFRTGPANHGNANFAGDRGNFNPVHHGNFGNRNGPTNHGNINAGNFGRNTNPHIQRNQDGINSPITWDDNRNEGFNINTNFGGWGNRLSRVGHNAQNDFVGQNRNNFGPGHIRPFSNGHSGHQGDNPMPLQNPADFLKSTLEALVPGAKVLDIPTFSNGGNFRNANGGGHQRVYGSDIIKRGPDSFSRNTERGYHRNFEVTSNNGYQLTRRWSTDDIRRLDADGSRQDFNKDFIDVFRDDHSSN